jgi:hypothetical protein
VTSAAQPDAVLACLRAHWQRQQKEKENAGDTWTEAGFEFTNPDGTPQPVDAMAERMVQELLSRIADPGCDASHAVLDTKLVLRDST